MLLFTFAKKKILRSLDISKPIKNKTYSENHTLSVIIEIIVVGIYLLVSLDCNWVNRSPMTGAVVQWYSGTLVHSRSLAAHVGRYLTPPTYAHLTPHISYMSTWTGRDPSSSYPVHCIALDGRQPHYQRDK